MFSLNTAVEKIAFGAKNKIEFKAEREMCWKGK